MTKKGIGTNEFFDINKLSKDWGLIVFPISMSRIENAQSADNCVEYINIFNGDVKDNFKGSKVSAPKIGPNYIYTDLLYFPFLSGKNELKRNLIPQIIKHKNRFDKLIKKEGSNIQIHHAITYQTWLDVWINTLGDFGFELKRLKKIYEKDILFQKYVKEDCKKYNKRCTKKTNYVFS